MRLSITFITLVLFTAVNAAPIQGSESRDIASTFGTNVKRGLFKSKSTPPPAAKAPAASGATPSPGGCTVCTRSADGTIDKRGNCCSAPAQNDNAAAKGAGKGTQSSSQGQNLPALREGQIRLTTESTNRLDVGDTSPLIPGSKAPSGSSGEVFRVNWPGKTNQVAKKFKPAPNGQDVAAFEKEVQNLRALNLLTASGSSTLGPTGEVRPWIVTDLVPGKSLTKIDEFQQILRGPKEACLAFLETRCRLLSQAAVAFETRTGFFHGDLNDGNIHWTVLDNTTPPNLLDFGGLERNGSPQKQAALQEQRVVDDSVVDTNTFAIARCRLNWPARDCVGPSNPPPAKGVGSSSSAPPAKGAGSSSSAPPAKGAPAHAARRM